MLSAGLGASKGVCMVTEHKLPEGYRNKWIEKGKGTTFLGIPVEMLSKEDLFAMAIAGWFAEQEARDNNARTVGFMEYTNKARSKR